MSRISGYLYIFGCIVFTVYGQLIIKCRIVKYGTLPIPFSGKIVFLLKLFLDPLICSGFLAAFCAALFWMAAMTKFEVSFAYPFMSLSFVLVFIISALLLRESVNVYKISGLFLIVLGIIISSRSK